MGGHSAWPELYKVLADLSAEQQWALTSSDIEQYEERLRSLLSRTWDEANLRRILRNYHQDHECVEALCSPLHPFHQVEWEHWTQQGLQILYQKGLHWSYDDAVEFQDFMQTARLGLLQALPSFRYESKFSTWAYEVLVRSTISYIRHITAKKRLQESASLDQIDETDSQLPLIDNLERTCEAHVLLETCQMCLSQHHDPRLQAFFRLAVVEGCSTSEIGEIVGLSSSRVRGLLQQAMHLLRNDPAIKNWCNAVGND